MKIVRTKIRYHLNRQMLGDIDVTYTCLPQYTNFVNFLTMIHSFYTGNEMMKLAVSFQSSQGQPATRLLSSAKRVRSALRKPDRPQFVSAFCQSNCGDVSPNVLGAFCTDTGLPCDFDHSTCNGKNELCYGRGPGYDLFSFLQNFLSM